MQNRWVMQAEMETLRKNQKEMLEIKKYNRNRECL